MINWAHNESKNTISLDDFDIIFDDEKDRYPKDKFKFILKLMEKYELAYSKDGKKITIPHILREDQPDKLPDFPIQESLMLNYKSDQPLPPNTVCRLIVKRYGDIKDTELWRYGVVLKYKKDTIALVYEDDRNVLIKVKGNKKSEYISELRNTMNEIFESYKSENPELQYRLIVNEPVDNNSFKVSEVKSVMLSGKNIASHVANGKDSYYDALTNSNIPLNLTINEYKIDIHTDTIKYLALGGSTQTINKNTFNFSDCNLELQSDINSLIRALNSKKDSDIIGELRDIVSDLKEAETLKSGIEVKKSGLFGRLSNFIEDLSDENSQKHRIINGIRNGIKTAQKIAKGYNSVAQWVGWPQVPSPLLREKAD